MKISELISYLDNHLKPCYQEDYDNSGFQIGNSEYELSGVTVALDVTDEVVNEAISNGDNLIVCHHPLFFGSVRNISPHTATGRIALKLVEQRMCLYAAHTNLDNLDWGVNKALSNKIGLNNTEVLRPMTGRLRKLVTFVPMSHAEHLRQALFEAGAGTLGNYDQCSYNLDGTGTFRPLEGSNPYCGTAMQPHSEAETRIEVIYDSSNENHIVSALRQNHPYEEPAFDLYPTLTPNRYVGAGMVGDLEKPIDTQAFLASLKQKLSLQVLKHSVMHRPTAARIALCGGSGAFLITDAINAKADIFITADLKYHDYQRAEGRITLIDIGHFESEHHVKEVLKDLILRKNSTFACHLATCEHGYVYYV